MKTYWTSVLSGLARSGAIPLLLASVAFLAASAMLLASALYYDVPCLGSNNCMKLAFSAASRIGPIPIAAFGVLGSIALLLSIWIASNRNSSRALRLAYGLSVVGALISIVLVIYATLSLRLFCSWCTISCVAWSLSAIWFANRASQEEISFPEVPLRWQAATAIFLIAGFGITFAVSKPFAIIPTHNAEVFAQIETAELMGMRRHVLKKESPSMRIIMFGDLFCSACAEAFQETTKILESDPAIEFHFRHYPLDSHDGALKVAAITEIAHDHGVFWELLSLAFDQRVKTVDQVYELAIQVGVPKAEIDKRLADPEDKAYAIAKKDRTLAKKIELPGSPFFILIDEENNAQDVLGYGGVKEKFLQ